jgi:2,3-bisphosphoglycerate-independent phosphoglycerate mutase
MCYKLRREEKKLKRKAVLVSIDGLGDRPIHELGARTPLEAAVTPTLDAMASEGVVGLVDPYAPGIPCGTDVGHLCMLGYDPKEVYSGRGPIEAMGAGLEIFPGDVAFRCNFATVDNNGIVQDRRAGRINQGVTELAGILDNITLNENVIANFAPATEHRAVLVLRGVGLSPHVSDSDPGGKNEGMAIQPIRPLDATEAALKTARALEQYLAIARELLNQHPINKQRIMSGLLPANTILTRSGGIVTHCIPLKERFDGIRCAAVSGEITVQAIAKMTGMKTFIHPGITGSYDFNGQLKASAALELLHDNDLVLVHVKATDLAGHDGRWDAKKTIIEQIDKMVEGIKANSPPDTLIAITADHSTPCEVGEHSGDPVPVVIWGKGVRVDKQVTYGETSCSLGGLGRITGKDFFHILIDLMGFSKKLGA